VDPKLRTIFLMS